MYIHLFIYTYSLQFPYILRIYFQNMFHNFPLCVSWCIELTVAFGLPILIWISSKKCCFLEGFALLGAVGACKRKKERWCFSGGFRLLLELLVLMDMTKWRLAVQFRTFRIPNWLFEEISIWLCMILHGETHKTRKIIEINKESKK